MADAMLFGSPRVEPAVLTSRGFGFQLPRLEPALKHILHRQYT